MALPVGAGSLQATGFVTGDGDGGLAGGQLRYDHRLSDRFALFGEGHLGYGWGREHGLGYGATAGLLWTW